VSVDDEASSTTPAEIHRAINWSQLLLVVLLVGFGWTALKLSSLPDEIASVAPNSDSSGGYADQVVDQLLIRLDDLSVRLDQVCAIVSADRPAASAAPCASPAIQ
jgi:hypothetical protein